MVKDFCCCWTSRAVGILQRLAALSSGGSGVEGEDPTPPQGPAALMLRESPPHPRRHLGARLLATVPGLHQALCANLKLTGDQRYKRVLHCLAKQMLVVVFYDVFLPRLNHFDGNGH